MVRSGQIWPRAWIACSWAGLLCVRRADRDVQGGVRVAKGGGEDVGGPEVGARDEAKNLGLTGVVT